MTGRLVSLALVLAAVHGLEAQPRVDFSLLERVLEVELAENRTPGAALAVVLGDEIILAKGYGLKP